ncbi:hypothetical protein [Streptomyces hydrogenans]|uniref:hypothetical protein n=1 Tax=Streptomyces hydrogenans TaxID=1873719 RepID=UPI003323A68B
MLVKTGGPPDEGEGAGGREAGGVDAGGGAVVVVAGCPVGALATGDGGNALGFAVGEFRKTGSPRNPRSSPPRPVKAEIHAGAFWKRPALLSRAVPVSSRVGVGGAGGVEGGGPEG